MNAMLTDDDLTRLLEEAAGTYAVPAPDLTLPEQTPKPVWLRHGPQLGAAAAAVVALALVLQGGLGSGGSPSTQPSLAGASAERSAGQEASGSGGIAGADPNAVAPTSLQQTFGSAKAQGGAAGSAVPTGGGSGADSARVVKTGTLSLVVDTGKVSATVQRLQVLVAGVRGYVADSSSQEAGAHPTASLTVRVPVDAFDALRSQVRALKVKVVSESANGKDVTASYADTQAQIQSLTAARSRYLTILGGAKTIAETLTVQQRVDDVQQQIDRLEGQRRVLADQSDYGTLTFSVGETSDEVLVKATPTGWSKAWHDAAHGFTSGVQRLVADSGRTLLVLLVAVALLLLGRSGWLFARRRLV